MTSHCLNNYVDALTCNSNALIFFLSYLPKRVRQRTINKSGYLWITWGWLKKMLVYICVFSKQAGLILMSKLDYKINQAQIW